MSVLSSVAVANAAGQKLSDKLSDKLSNKLSQDELKKAMQRPLITGASISADWLAPSPGKKLAARFTAPGQVRTVAFGGTPGSHIIDVLTDADFKDRTAIIALDFFFWDSAFMDARPSLKALSRLVKTARAMDIPLVLGEIPELLPGRQPLRSKLNSALVQACAEYRKCFMMPFIDLHGRVHRDRHLMIEGKRHSIAELMPDGLHLSSLGSEYLAGVMQQVLCR